MSEQDKSGMTLLQRVRARAETPEGKAWDASKVVVVRPALADCGAWLGSMGLYGWAALGRHAGRPSGAGGGAGGYLPAGRRVGFMPGLDT